MSREEIMEYLDTNKIIYRIDTSNMDSRFLRNRIRNDLLPLLEKDFNPHIREVLINISKILDCETDYLDNEAMGQYTRLVTEEERQTVLNITDFQELPEAIQRAVLRLIIKAVKGDLIGITYHHVDDLTDLIFHKPTGKRIHLPVHITAMKEYDNLLMWQGKHVRPAAMAKGAVKIPGTTLFQHPHLDVMTEILTADDIDIGKLTKHAGCLSKTWDDHGTNGGISEFEEFFDADRLGKPLYFRSRKEGDRFSPIGLGGSKKVAEILINEKISPRLRESIPLLATKTDIAWIVGYRISEQFKIRDDTSRILRVKVRFFVDKNQPE